MSDTGRPEQPEPGTLEHLRAELERIANEHPNPHDARWIRGASSALYAFSRRAEQADPKLLAIAAIVNGYYNGEELDALAAFRALRAIADALGPPMEPEPSPESITPHAVAHLALTRKTDDAPETVDWASLGLAELPDDVPTFPSLRKTDKTDEF